MLFLDSEYHFLDKTIVNSQIATRKALTFFNEFMVIDFFVSVFLFNALGWDEGEGVRIDMKVFLGSHRVRTVIRGDGQIKPHPNLSPSPVEVVYFALSQILDVDISFTAIAWQ